MLTDFFLYSNCFCICCDCSKIGKFLWVFGCIILYLMLECYHILLCILNNGRSVPFFYREFIEFDFLLLRCSFRFVISYSFIHVLEADIFRIHRTPEPFISKFSFKKNVPYHDSIYIKRKLIRSNSVLGFVCVSGFTVKRSGTLFNLVIKIIFFCG